MTRSHPGMVPVLVATLVSGGCSEPKPAFVVQSTRELGTLEQAPVIKGRDGGYSGLVGTRSVWLYGDTILARPGEDGTAWRHNTWSMTSDLDASDSITGFSEDNDGKGVPREFFPQTAAEAAFNRAHSEAIAGKDGCAAPCGARWALWPGPLVFDVARGRALIVYTKIYGEPGEWNFRSVGTGIATWEGPGTPVKRPEPSPGTQHPTLLFAEGEPQLASGAVVQDGRLYLLGCHGQDKRCLLARAPLADALRRSAWRFYAGDDRWSAAPGDAEPLFRAMDMTSLHYNAHLRAWLAIYSPPFANEVRARSAPSLTGPWSSEVKLFDARPPGEAGKFAYCGLGHPEYARHDGRLEVVSYYRATAPWTGELRLVQLELARAP